MTKSGCATCWMRRVRLVHPYFDINLEILWQTVQGDLPPWSPSWSRLCVANWTGRTTLF